MKLIACLSLLCFFTPLCVFAQEFNAGIVQGLWYSQEKFFVGETVRIYVAIRNNTGSDLTGTVEFNDGEARIGRKTVQALDGRIIESWADWTPTYGTHTLSANLSRIELHKIGSSTQPVEVVSALADDSLFVDYDTDEDGVGNGDDSDDDGDKISDTDEKEQGSNPLVKNSRAQEADDAEDEEEESNEEDRMEIAESTSNTTGSSDPAGLERFLSDSPAENVLSSVTQYITETKDTIDIYREKRNEAKATERTASSTPVNADGFGEITRASSSASSFNLSDFVSSIFKLLLKVFDFVYTAVLAVVSFILSYPILVQVGALILILVLLFKFASGFGKRPRKFK
jgi:hypothetical protein